MDKDEALKLALEALERSVATCFDRYSHDQVMSKPDHFINQTITSIREALAKPEQEPVCVAFMRTYLESGQNGLEIWKDEPLYTTPPQRQPLTDEQCINQMLNSGFERNSLGWSFTYGRLDYHLLKFARAIEAAHGIKEREKNT